MDRGGGTFWNVVGSSYTKPSTYTYFKFPKMSFAWFVSKNKPLSLAFDWFPTQRRVLFPRHVVQRQWETNSQSLVKWKNAAVDWFSTGKREWLAKFQYLFICWEHYPARRAIFCILEWGGQTEALPLSRQTFEVTEARTNGLVNLVVFRQTGFSSASIRLFIQRWL